MNLKHLPPSIIEQLIIPLSPNSARRLLRRKNPHLVRFFKVIVKQRWKHQKRPLMTKVSVVSKESSHDINNISPTIMTYPYQRIHQSTCQKKAEYFLSLTTGDGIHLHNKTSTRENPEQAAKRLDPETLP